EVALHNVEGEAGTYRIAGSFETEASAEGLAKAPPGFERAVTLAAGELRREAFPLKPAEVGETTLALRVTGPGGVDVRRTLTFDVKVPAGDIRRVTVSTLKPGGGSIAVSGDLLSGLIPARSRLTLSVGPNGALDVPGLLAALDRYPYGCAEQTVSRA